MRQLSDLVRRHRLASRHGLVRRHDSVAAATEAMTALHATEAATVHLALWARVEGVTVAAVDRALYDEQSIVKQLAMRRTLFAFPRDLLPAAWGSASLRVARQQRAQLAKNVAAAGLAEGEAAVEEWIEAAAEAVLAVLADGTARTTREVRERVPALDGRISVGGGPGKKWGGELPVGSWVMGTLGAEGRIVRAANAGHWRLNKPAWTTTAHWLGEVPEPLPEAAGYAALVARWLATFGPGTEADIVWWLGATKTAVRRALADLDAEQVGLDDGGTGWVLPGDTGTDEEVSPWAALLPTLDPTVMGWKERGFYLDPADTPYLFDSNGNAGNTAWWDGRIVGCWVQDDAARVHLVLREDVPAAGRAALEEEAERLTAWLDGTRITNVYASPQMRGARLP
ncbi:winged helix DNA-binding domain-containing protein [Nocardioides sp. LML1-1-1.1]|uniref:winged helix DNA-binding domain-containing protein n=1 Tax=Nocardioides sp. LML1-1-1.1 TaxID=3135248 RepID=UPI00342BAC67